MGKTRKEFGVRIRREDRDGLDYVGRWELTDDNLHTVLNIYGDYRVEGDFDKLHDFLTNPERRHDRDLYLGQTESSVSPDEEYFAVRLH